MLRVTDGASPLQGLRQLAEGLRIQRRVLGALVVRELHTRFGRENIGFLWMMVEPMLFAGLVGLLWQVTRGEADHGIGVVAFVASGYIPLTLFRNSAGRAVGVFVANSSLMYHRQIQILDFILVRCFIEAMGATMAFVCIGTVLYLAGMFPVPADPGLLVAGWSLYVLFTFSVSLVLAPLSDMSEVLEKILPVSVYIMIPFSGTFNLTQWLAPKLRDVMYWSPPVNAMEMIRYGIFGDAMRPYYDPVVPVWASLGLVMVGLILCRRVRRTLVVE